MKVHTTFSSSNDGALVPRVRAVISYLYSRHASGLYALRTGTHKASLSIRIVRSLFSTS